MLGIVLCGGQSLRMGSDKGLLKHDDKLWAELAGDKLESLNMEVKFSVNPHQTEKYLNYFDQAQLITDQIFLDINGPLKGVLSVHASNPDEDLFLLACDLLKMESRFLAQLIQAKNLDHSFEAYLFQRDKQQEPLCAIYTAVGLKKITTMLRSEKLEKHSMKFVLSRLKVCELILENKDYRFFENFNSQSEVKGL